MIYILIALALFGILTAVLAQQSAQTDNENMAHEVSELQTTQILAYAQGAQSSVNQMIMSGTQPTSIDFTLPSGATFDTPPFINKVFHPDGGGLNAKAANTEIFSGGGTDPAPGWYMGRFANIDWTPSGASDIVLAAYKISEPICESINEKVTGSTAIPKLISGDLRDYFVDTTLHTGGANLNLTAGICAACQGYANLCVADSTGTLFTFYVIIEGL